MTKIHRFCLYICFIVLSPLVSSDVVKMAMNEFCPYHCTNINSASGWDDAAPGYAYEIYKEIYSSAGYEFKAIRNHFERGMMSAYSGEVDAVSGPIKMTSRHELEMKTQESKDTGHIYGKLIYSEEPISAYHSSCFFGKSELKWEYNGVQSLFPYRMSAVKSFDYGENLNSYIQVESGKTNSSRLQLLFGNNIHLRGFNMLSSGRVDIVLADLQVGLYTINKMEKEQHLEKDSIKLLGCTEEGKRYLYVGFSPVMPKKSRTLAQVYDQGIIKLRSSGRLKIILDKYGLTDWVFESQY